MKQSRVFILSFLLATLSFCVMMATTAKQPVTEYEVVKNLTHEIKQD